MNLLQLVFKQMRQRALSTWLTMLAVLLGVALAVAIMITMRGSEAIFGQNDFGYDVIVSEIPRLTGLKMGEEFQATHGLPQPGEQPDIHKPQWKVVGILRPTHTASDGIVYIPLTSFYCIAEHDVGLVAQEAIREGK